jgi:nucleoside recognition membrane protein YjiH
VITNFFSSGAILFTLIAVDGTAAVPTSIGACIAVMFIMKIVGANLLRLILTFTGKEALVNNRQKETPYECPTI